jgi:hypothetical protein
LALFDLAEVHKDKQVTLGGAVLGTPSKTKGSKLDSDKHFDTVYQNSSV